MEAISRRTSLLAVFALTAMSWVAKPSLAESKNEPEDPGKQHAIRGGKNIQPTPSHIRKDVERRRQRRSRKKTNGTND